MFEIPIAVFFFKRYEKTIKIINRIKKINPLKIYLISDGPSFIEEKKDVEKCRKEVENAINWKCEVIKNYAEKNEGIYNRIGLGAKWVLSQEESAIFLEDDNLPEVSFFYFCKEMLSKYKNDNRIFWICGTNYLGKYEPKNNASYIFTKHVLPCGWASWSSKYNKYYDGDLKLLNSKYVRDNLKYQYGCYTYYYQRKVMYMEEYSRIKNNKNPKSWDYQLDITIRANSFFGIVPAKNQIKNIGADSTATHGGSMLNPMNIRFCGMNSYSLDFPLRHPLSVMIDNDFENKIKKIILMPYWYMIGIKFAKFIRRCLHISDNISISQIIFQYLEKIM